MWTLFLLSCAKGPSPSDDISLQESQPDDSTADDSSADDSATDDSSTDDTGDGSAVIGSEGGTVSHPGGASVTIPPGALSEDVEITITEITDGSIPSVGELAITGIWDFGPDGITFAENVTVTLPLTGTLDEEEDALLGYYDPSDGDWYLLVPLDELDDHVPNEQVVDRDAGTISAPTNHFTAISGATNRLTGPSTYTSGEFSYQAYDVECSWAPRNRVLRTGTVSAVVVHSTASTRENNSTQAGACWMASTSASAQFMIGRGGRIVHLWDPGDYNVAHVAAKVDCTGGSATTSPTSTAVRSFSSGIELQNSEPNHDQAYSGAQMNSLLTLVDYHIDRFELDRPAYPRGINSSATSVAVDNTWNAHTDASVVYHREVDGCRVANLAPGSAHLDPVGDFRAQAFERALSRDFRGQIDVSGGDAYGSHAPGDSGDVWIEEDSTVAVSRQGSSLEVAAGATQTLSGSHSYDDVVIQGTLTLSADTTLNVYGTLFVADGGRIEGPGVDLTVNAGGLVLVDGLIDLSGADGYAVSDTDFDAGGDWGACFYDVDGTEAAGSDGGDFELRVKAGPLFIPTLLAMGGDAYEYDPSGSTSGITGGDGGSVNIVVDDARAYFQGGPPRPLAFVLGTQSKTLEPPGCDPDDNSFGLIQPKNQDVRRGIITSGGAGPRSTKGGSSAGSYGQGGPGGVGGDVQLVEGGDGRLVFLDYDIWTGAGVNNVQVRSYVRDLSQEGHFQVPTGGMGGRGQAGHGARGGDGGAGGTAGDVSITGDTNLQSVSASGSTVYGWNGDNPNTVYPSKVGSTELGTAQVWPTTDWHSLRVVVAAGSGGAAGGSVATYPGDFGTMGVEGSVTVP